MYSEIHVSHILLSEKKTGLISTVPVQIEQWVSYMVD